MEAFLGISKSAATIFSNNFPTLSSSKGCTITQKIIYSLINYLQTSKNIYQDPLKRNYLIKCLKIIQILEKKKGELYLFNF